MKKLGFVLISVGVGAIGLLQAKDSLPQAIANHLTPDTYKIYTVIGLVVFAVGVVALAGDFLASSLRAIKVPRRFSCLPARTSDVSEVHAFATALLGPGLSGINQMKGWLKTSERSIMLVHSERRANGKRTKVIAGYFCNPSLGGCGCRVDRAGHSVGQGHS